MRITYPNPPFSSNYKFKLVDSTFLHAIHLAQNVGTTCYSLGISFIKDEDNIYWYIVGDAKELYEKLTDSRKSPGFTYNNSIKGKQFSVQKVKDTPSSFKDWNPTPIKVGVSSRGLESKDVSVKGDTVTVNGNPSMKWRLTFTKPTTEAILNHIKPTKVEDAKPTESTGTIVKHLKETEPLWKRIRDGSAKLKVTNNQPEPFVYHNVPKKPVGPATIHVSETQNFGPLLDTCTYRNSTCISYLALGYNRTTKGFVIYYTLRENPQKMYVIQTDDASIYRKWINAESLGRHFNKHIRFNLVSKSITEDIPTKEVAKRY